MKAFKNMVIREIVKMQFNKAWRKRNNHNFTIAKSTFPVEKVEVGNYTYGNLNVRTYGSDNEYLKIGHFVSIGTDTKFILGGNHPSDTLSTYPFQQKIFGKQTLSYSKGPIVIEDDVWIGESVIILSGITIGQGAVVGTGSVVTKSVEPYSIVAGNPAVLKKYRFSNDVITELLKINYSNLTPSIIEENIEFLSHKKIEDINAVGFFSAKME
ncbi:CatB-related O-acetyltransferase [Mucilaginibacter sp. BJC16-A38]|uniref:CatB-related O-acetyltransferase n=1 Tax=Mucilaginibacter phenanthrenivorans TaxID=1234842 RepID=UPI0021575A42|nr:CatB-related O-acetyltransferase [Mucilaginibacter phenanthrenivorans]MCR8559722.1 CatB-related O-acetyltransferase [Mucilaginibacter phenanthrenivorans]